MMTDEQMHQAMRGWFRTGRYAETVCGSGSRIENTAAVRKTLPEWIEKYRIESLADAGAGDLNWISKIALSCVTRYYDLIVRKPEVAEWDITRTPLPMCDAILCRYVLNHLDRERVVMALENFRKSARYLIATQFDGVFDDPQAFVRWDLTLEPFSMGEHLEKIQDTRGHLALWRMN